jgi:hypothetical protein
MSETDVTTDISGHTVGGDVAAGCAVCPHPRAAHDRIATRYCSATVAGSFSRGCVCTPYPDGAGHR